MSIPLSEIRNCFEGVIPSSIATLDRDGIPNISYLSQVVFVDDEHVALTNQFFSKTAANVQETGEATVLVVDGRTGEQYELDLTFDRSVREGETFARLAAQIQATGPQHGEGVAWSLRSADIYRVRSCRRTPVQPPPEEAPLRRGAADPLACAARLASDLAVCTDPDAMLDSVLDGLHRDLDYANVILLLADGPHDRLTTVGSRGYPAGGVGSEVPMGRGAIGAAALYTQPVRISDMSRGRRFAAAVQGEPADAARSIPLPGLAEPQSQMAAPMIGGGRLRGVLFAEDARRFRFTHADEAAMTIVAAQLAASLRLWELEGQTARPTPRTAPAHARPVSAFQVRYYTFDDSLFIDGAYLIKGVPGRLLLYFLRAYSEAGRTEFTNRELRLDAALRLPELKDNLETRLILLRRRLEEKGAPVRIARPARGRIRLELSGTPSLEVI